MRIKKDFRFIAFILIGLILGFMIKDYFPKLPSMSENRHWTTIAVLMQKDNDPSIMKYDLSSDNFVFFPVKKDIGEVNQYHTPKYVKLSSYDISIDKAHKGTYKYALFIKPEYCTKSISPVLKKGLLVELTGYRVEKYQKDGIQLKIKFNKADDQTIKISIEKKSGWRTMNDEFNFNLETVTFELFYPLHPDNPKYMEEIPILYV